MLPRNTQPLKEAARRFVSSYLSTPLLLPDERVAESRSWNELDSVELQHQKSGEDHRNQTDDRHRDVKRCGLARRGMLLLGVPTFFATIISSPGYFDPYRLLS